MKNKLRITIECAGQPTRTIEAVGIAAVLLNEGSTENTHNISALVQGHMSVVDLLHLHDGVGDELTTALEANIVKDMTPDMLVQLLKWRAKNGTDR